MYRELKLPSDKPVVKQIKKETYILFMITYLEIGFFFPGRWYETSDLHAYIRAPCTYWEGFNRYSPWCVKAFEKLTLHDDFGQHNDTGKKKNQQTTEPRPASLESSVQKLCNIRIQQSIDLINLSFPITWV